MVFCSYCGKENKDSDLRCSNCGKPLSLLPNTRLNTDSDDSTINEVFDRKFRSNNNKNKNKKYSKNSYEDMDKNISSDPKYNNYKIADSYLNNEKNSIKGSNFKDQYLNNGSSIGSEYFKDHYLGEKRNHGQIKPNKGAVEWDVVIATALIVIIIFSVISRISQSFGLLFGLLIGLLYILIATKSKLSLIKAIPLSIVVVFAILAYLSL